MGRGESETRGGAGHCLRREAELGPELRLRFDDSNIENLGDVQVSTRGP
jgi:hypothetical protein